MSVIYCDLKQGAMEVLASPQVSNTSFFILKHHFLNSLGWRLVCLKYPVHIPRKLHAIYMFNKYITDYFGNISRNMYCIDIE